MSPDKDRPLSTADLAAAADRQRNEPRGTPRPEAAERAERSERATARNEPRADVRPEPPMSRGTEPARPAQPAARPDAAPRAGAAAQPAGAAEMAAAEQAVSSAEAVHAPHAERSEPSRTPQAEARHAAASAEEKLEALFAPEAAQGFRSHWDEVQIGFVDDPKKAVRQADELVAQVMQSLAQTFAHERTRLEAQLNDTNRESTENLRVALRRYRSFFQRLLSL